jgi:hypothetical protein
MPSANQTLIRDVLAEAGPRPFKELVAACVARAGAISRNPAQTIRSALTNDPLCQLGAGDRYVFLPAIAAGASVRLPVRVERTPHHLAAGGEVIALLLQQLEGGSPGPPRAVALEDGPTATFGLEHGRGAERGIEAALSRRLLPSPEFWEWWERYRRRGEFQLELRCEDGMTARFSARAIRRSSLDEQAVAARNDALRAAAVDALSRNASLLGHELGRRLLARGVYHGTPPPDPVADVLFRPAGQFVIDRGLWIVYRKDLTPALRKLFAHRIEEMTPDAFTLESLLRLGPARRPRRPRRLPARRQARHLYRLTVRLAWDKKVWRRIEIMDTNTLHELHEAIQDAFDWDNDHLYAFFMSGRAWDQLTEIEGSPYGDPDEADPPTAVEVQLADLDLAKGQRFLYIFDFGDELRHEIEVQAATPAPGEGEFPRIVASHGEAPPQYGTWDEDEDEDDWNKEDDEE